MITKKTASGYLQLFLVIILLIGVYLTGTFLEYIKVKPSISQPKIMQPSVQAATLKAQDWQLNFQESAQIQPRAIIPIIPEINGRIQSISQHVAAGECFQAMEVLFSLETDEINAEHQANMATLEQAKANYALVKAEAEAAITEWKILNPKQQAPLLVARIPQQNQSLAAIKAAQAKLNLSGVRLKDAQFSFPFAGCIITSSIEKGQFASRGQPLGQAYARDGLEAVVNLPQQMVDLLQQSNFSTSITIDGKDQPAIIQRISQNMNDKTQFTPVVLKPKQTDRLQINQIIQAKFTDNKPRQVFVVSEQDLFNNKTLRIIQDDQTIINQNIDILSRQGDKIYIAAPRDQIKIVHNYQHALANGTQIRVRASE